MHKKLNTNRLIGGLHFPIIQALPTDIEKNAFKRFFKFLKYRRKFQITEDYCLWVPSINKWIFLPKGFEFDGASVPKILNSLYSPTGMLFLGAAPHDFGYRYKGLLHMGHKGYLHFTSYTKKELDVIFRALCAYESNMKKASSVATLALSAFGFLGWNENRKANQKLMDDFPELYKE